MGTILVIFIFLSKFFVILLKLFWALLAPLLGLIVIIGAIRFFIYKVEKRRYYDYCKRNQISPADYDENFSDMTRDNIYRERDSWL